MEVISLFVLILFPVLMLYAAFSDLFTMKISNWISLILITVFPILAFFLKMDVAEIFWHFACALLVTSITFMFFYFGWIGGGDAKLAGSTALWFGFTQVYDYAIYASLFGGALTLVLLLWRSCPMPKLLLCYGWIARLHDAKVGIPYGIALAIAALIIYPQTSIWSALQG